MGNRDMGNKDVGGFAINTTPSDSGGTRGRAPRRKPRGIGGAGWAAIACGGIAVVVLAILVVKNFSNDGTEIAKEEDKESVETDPGQDKNNKNSSKSPESNGKKSEKLPNKKKPNQAKQTKKKPAKPKPNRAKQNKAKQNQTKPGKAKTNSTKQNQTKPATQPNVPKKRSGRTVGRRDPDPVESPVEKTADTQGADEQVEWTAKVDNSTSDEWKAKQPWKAKPGWVYHSYTFSPSGRILLLLAKFGNKDVWALVDLASGKTMTEGADGHGSQVSNDGKLFADKYKNEFHFGQVGSKQSEQKKDLGDKGDLRKVFFGNDGSLWSIQLTRGKMEVVCTCWDAKSGESVRELVFDPPKGRGGNVDVIESPGGKYLVVNSDGRPRVYDSQSGEAVGVGEEIEGGVGIRDFIFSPDGKKLAGHGLITKVETNAETGGTKKTRKWVLAVWDFSTGKIVRTHWFTEDPKTIDLTVRNYKGPPLLWLPNGAGWIMNGTHWFELESGKLAWSTTIKGMELRHREVYQRVLPGGQMIRMTRHSPDVVEIAAGPLPVREIVASFGAAKKSKK